MAEASAHFRSRGLRYRGSGRRSEEADVDPQGRLIVTVGPDAPKKVQLYVYGAQLRCRRHRS